MTFNEYLSTKLDSVVMITVTIDNNIFQYNHWNWFQNLEQLVLLKDDYTIGHILNTGRVLEQEDGSIIYGSEYKPNNCILNFYFGGVKN